MARWLGLAEAVTAVTRRGLTQRPGPSGPIETDIPDHVLALAEYADDVTAIIEMSARTNALEPDGVTIHGTTGSLVVHFASERIERIRPGGDRETVTIRDEDRAGWTAERDFVAAIRGDAEVTMTDFATGVAYMAFLEAVEESAASGRRIAIRHSAGV